MIQNSIRELVRYGLATGLIEPEDTIYTTNRLLELFGLDELEDADTPTTADRSEEPELVAKLESILKDMLDYAAENGLLENNSVVYRDLFDTKIMSILVAGKQYKYYMIFQTKQPDYPGAYSLERFMEIVKGL